MSAPDVQGYWVHLICAVCWEKRRGNAIPSTVKVPPEDEEESCCCFCGKAILGTLRIYVRHNPAELGCSHTEPGESGSTRTVRG